jgi:very-short-patch-repair endonuclease
MGVIAVPYQSQRQKQNTRTLRTNMTDAERAMWKVLRMKQLNHIRFRRQVPIGNYIADFASFSPKIVIEIDGGQHNGSASDITRDDWLRAQGFEVLRFWNNDVLANIDGVAQRIAEMTSPLTPPSHLSPVKGEGGYTPSLSHS